MAYFYDLEKRKWDISITVGTLMDVERDCGVNLLELCSADGEAVNTLVNRLFTDDIFTAKIIGSILTPQFEKSSITPEELFRSIDGKVLDECINAFVEELKVFFGSRRRDHVKKLIEKTQYGVERIYAKADEIVESVNVDEMIDAPRSGT